MMHNLFQILRIVFKRVLGDARLPETSEIREPTIKDVFGACCGPRLLSQALELHGEDVSRKSPERNSDNGYKAARKQSELEP